MIQAINIQDKAFWHGEPVTITTYSKEELKAMGRMYNSIMPRGRGQNNGAEQLIGQRINVIIDRNVGDYGGVVVNIRDYYPEEDSYVVHIRSDQIKTIERY